MTDWLCVFVQLPFYNMGLIFKLAVIGFQFLVFKAFLPVFKALQKKMVIQMMLREVLNSFKSS